MTAQHGDESQHPIHVIAHSILASRYFRFMFSLLAALATGVIMINTVVGAGQLRETYKARDELLLSSYLDYFEQLTQDMNSSAYLISQIPETITFLMNPVEGELVELFKLSLRLRSFYTNASNAIVQSILLYYPEGGYIFSSNEAVYKAFEYGDQAFVAAANSLGNLPAWLWRGRSYSRDEQDVTDSIIYLCRYRINSHPYIIGIELSSERLDNITNLIPLENQQALYLSCGTEIIHATDWPASPEIQQLLDAPDTSDTVEIDGSRRTAIHCTGSGLVATLLHAPYRPIDLFTHALSDRLPLWLLLLSAAFLVAGLYSFAFHVFSGKVLGHMNDRSETSALSMIKSPDLLLEKADEFTELMSSYNQLLKERYVTSLLLGSGSVDDGADYGIAMNTPYLNAMIVRAVDFDAVESNRRRDELTVYVNELLSKRLAAFGLIQTVISQNGDWLCVLGSNENPFLGGKAELSCILEEIRLSLIETDNIATVFSVGVTVDSPEKLYASFISARNNLDTLSAYENETLAFSEPMEDLPTIERPWESAIIDAVLSRSAEDARQRVAAAFSEWTDMSPTNGRRMMSLLLFELFTEMFERNILIPMDFVSYSFNRLASDPEFDPPAFFVDLVARLFAAIDSCGENTVQNKRVQNAIDYILANYQRDISVTDIADSVGVTAIYLNRIFKLSTGKTIGEYLNHYRISVAKELLGNVGMRLTDISRAIGYSDVRRFSNQFKKAEGLLPGKYRQQFW